MAERVEGRDGDMPSAVDGFEGTEEPKGSLKTV